VSSSTSIAQAKPTTTIVLFGDSIIAGYGLAEQETLAVQLEAYLESTQHDIKVINAGVSGDTTSAGLTRIAWTLQRTKPDIVLLALGANDVLRGLPPATTAQNLDAMLEILQNNDIKVILSRVDAPANLGKTYAQELKTAYETLATSYEVPLYPFLLQDIFNQPKLMLPDGIHPSAAGIKAITKPLGNYIIEYMAKKIEPMP